MNRNPRPGWIWAIWACLLLTNQAVGADILFDDITASSIGADNVAANLGATNQLAQSFGTSSQAVLLTKVSLKLKSDSGGGNFTIHLLSNSSNTPGSSLTSIAIVNDSALTNTLENYEFTLGTPFLLETNTRYWIRLDPGSAGNTSAQWSYTNDVSGIGVNGEYTSNDAGTMPSNEYGPYQMRVEATAVPEPSMLILATAGALALFIKRPKATSPKP